METGIQLNVLVVDDNQINRLLISKVLNRWGIHRSLPKTVQAVEKIEGNHNLDVVLMDVHMPIMDGVEATRIIRSKEEAFYQQLPIIALTASMLISEINEIHECGMNDYILKPFDPKGFTISLQSIRKLVEFKL